MRFLLVPALAAALAGPALTASNGVVPGTAGSGSGPISGYAVSSVSYALDGDTVEAVSFDVSPAGARSVQARLAPDEPWSPCTLSGGRASCSVATPLAAAVALEVSASS